MKTKLFARTARPSRPLLPRVRRGRRVRRRIAWTGIIVLLLAGVGNGAGTSLAGAPVAVSLDKPFTGSISVIARVTMPVEAPETLTLAALRSGADADRALVVAWVREDGGWFGPTWRLQLHSDQSLLPRMAERGAARHSDWNTDFVTLSTIPPRPGHTYETWLSFDPASGSLSLWIYDQDTTAPVYVDRLVLSSTDAPLYPGAVGPGAAEVAAYPLFLPRAVGWGLVEYVAGVPGPAPRAPVDRALSLAAAVHFEAPSPGSFHLVVEQNGETKQLAEASTEREGPLLIPIPSGELPQGRAKLRLEYHSGGKVWFVEERELRVGRIELGIEEVTLKHDGDETVLAGRVRLEADGRFPELAIELEYAAGIPERAAPLYENWRTIEGMLVLPVTEVSASRMIVPFNIPLDALDELAGRAEPLFVTLTARVETDVETFESGVVHKALGERLSPFPKVGQYTVLRGDFHIHTSESHDSEVSPAWRTWEAFRYGYDVIALTDHGSTRAFDRTEQLAQELGLIVLRGFETGLDNAITGEHFTAIGVDTSFAPRDPHTLSRDPGRSRRFYQDEFRAIDDHGGFIVYAHPGWPNPRLETDSVRWLVDHGLLHGVEVRGPRERVDWAFDFALEHGLALIEGSDAHEARDPVSGDQAPVSLVLVDEPGAEGVLPAMRAGRTLVWRAGVLRGAEEWLHPLFEAMIDVRVVQEEGAHETRASGDPPGVGACLKVANAGPLPLRAVVRTDPAPGGSGRIYAHTLEPFASVCLQFAVRPGSVEIVWENVYSGPQTMFRTVHALAAEDE